jgi:hypothetical protein
MAELEFLADMNISPLSVEILRESGLHIIRITEVMVMTVDKTSARYRNLPVKA